MPRYREKQELVTSYVELAAVRFRISKAGDVSITLLERAVTNGAEAEIGEMVFPMDPTYEIPLRDAAGLPTGNTMRMRRLFDALNDLYAAQAELRDAAPLPPEPQAPLIPQEPQQSTNPL